MDPPICRDAKPLDDGSLKTKISPYLAGYA